MPEKTEPSLSLITEAGLPKKMKKRKKEKFHMGGKILFTLAC